MSASDVQRWQDANQRQLFGEVAVLRALLDGADEAELAAARAALAECERELEGPSAIETLATAFSLTEFERAVIVLAAATELEPGFGECCAKAAADPRRPWATFALALSRIPGAHWSALSASAALRRYRLIELEPGESALHGRLQISERVLVHLCGLASLDARLQGICELVGVPADEDLAPSQGRAIARLCALWRRC